MSDKNFARAFAAHYRERALHGAERCYIRAIESATDANEALKAYDARAASMHVMAGALFGLCATAFGAVAWALEEGT